MENRVQKMGYGYINEYELISRDKLFSMKNVADIIGKKGFGRTKLYSILREKNLINEKNVAYEQYIQNGYFVNQQRRRDLGGVHAFTNQVLVTPLGLELIKKIMNNY